MTTKGAIQSYFDSLKQQGDWKALLDDSMSFTSFVTPIKRVVGKNAYLEATKRFFSMVTSVEIKELIVEGKTACALTRYVLQPPVGPTFESHVAEVFEVQDGKIISLDIYFDSAPFPKPAPAAT